MNTLVYLFSFLLIRSMTVIINKCVWDNTKVTAHQSPNCIRKTKTVRICPITKIMWKTTSSHKILLKLGNQLLTHGHKRFLIWRPSAILNFKNSHLVTWLSMSSSSESADVYQISSKLDDFLSRYSDFTICNMATVRHLEFSKFRLYITWHQSPCYSATLCKI